MNGVVPDRICVFEIARSAGNSIEELTVELPTAWAQTHAVVEVELTNRDDEFGWHAALVGDRQAYLVGFPWHDHVDVMLRAQDTRQLPIYLAEDPWHDVEQGWWATAIPVGPWVVLAEANFNEVVNAVRDPRSMTRSNPDVVTVDGVDIRWTRAERAAYEQAWSRAIAYFSPTD